MSGELRVPALGESIVEATVGKWLKREGDTVTAGEPLVELETDKVNLEVAAEQSGVLTSIVKGEGATVNIGDVLATIGENGAAAASPQQPQAESQPPAAGEQKAAGNGQQPEPGRQEAATVAETPPAGDNDVLATPVAQRVASEYNIDIRSVKGSGPGGRVTKEDVLRHVAPAGGKDSVQETQPQPAARPAPPSRPTAPASAPTPTPTPSPAIPQALAPDARREERIRMSRRRQTIARRLVEAQHTAAMLTTFNEIDMSAVMAVRQRRKERFKERYGIGLGFMSFFVKASIGALKAFPLLNAEIQGDEIVVKHYYDIGVAVGTEEGLVVPVVRDADRKTFADVEREIADLASRARRNELSLPELQGGTFTITNGGIYGSLMSTPILNTPQVGILGMHKIEERPVVVNGEVAVRPMMYVALSYDHRIVDGSEAVRFLVRIKELVEDPEALLLEG